MVGRSALLLILGWGSVQVAHASDSNATVEESNATAPTPYFLKKTQDKGVPYTCPDSDDAAVCECRHAEECNAAPKTKTLVCRNAGDCNCKDVDMCICENVGECACMNAKNCFCNSIGNCWHKPDTKVHVWECPNDDEPGLLWTRYVEEPLWADVVEVKHRCTRKPCDHIWNCTSGECVLQEQEYTCNMQLIDSFLMQERLSEKGNNVCEVCPPNDRYDPRGKRCNPDCIDMEPYGVEPYTLVPDRAQAV